jgi:hypothetical protein
VHLPACICAREALCTCGRAAACGCLQHSLTARCGTRGAPGLQQRERGAAAHLQRGSGSGCARCPSRTCRGGRPARRVCHPCAAAGSPRSGPRRFPRGSCARVPPALALRRSLCTGWGAISPPRPPPRLAHLTPRLRNGIHPYPGGRVVKGRLSTPEYFCEIPPLRPSGTRARGREGAFATDRHRKERRQRAADWLGINRHYSCFRPPCSRPGHPHTGPARRPTAAPTVGKAKAGVTDCVHHRAAHSNHCAFRVLSPISFARRRVARRRRRIRRASSAFRQPTTIGSRRWRR